MALKDPFYTIDKLTVKFFTRKYALESEVYTKHEITQLIQPQVTDSWGTLTQQTETQIVFTFSRRPTSGTFSFICDYGDKKQCKTVFTFVKDTFISFTISDEGGTVYARDDGKYTVDYGVSSMDFTATYTDVEKPISNFKDLKIDMTLDNHTLKVHHVSSDNIDGCLDVYSKAAVDEKLNAINPTIVSQTVTHDTVPEEDINNYQIGRPVFLTGNAYMNRNNKWIPSMNAPTDCICGVKTSGTWKEYVGVVTNVDKVNNMVEFATHGDFYFTVDDSSKYKIGDTILYDGRILNDDMMINNKMIRMTVGVISAKINATTLAVFRD